MHDPRPWGTHGAALVLGLGGGKRGLRGLELRLEVNELESRQRAAEDQRAFGLELGALLRRYGLRLRHLRLARLVREDGEDVALLDRHSALDFQLGQHPSGARGDGDSLVGLGAAGDGELAAVRNDTGRGHRDPEELLRLGFAGARGHAALRLVVRQKVPGSDPKPGGRDKADGGEAARVHRELSTLVVLRGGRDSQANSARRQARCITATALELGIGPAHRRKSPDPYLQRSNRADHCRN
jgi:hypothetical protein